LRGALKGFTNTRDESSEVLLFGGQIAEGDYLKMLSCLVPLIYLSLLNDADLSFEDLEARVVRWVIRARKL